MNASQMSKSYLSDTQKPETYDVPTTSKPDGITQFREPVGIAGMKPPELVAKQEFRVAIEISENSKQEPAITIKVRADDTADSALEEALKTYKKAKEGLGRS